MYKDLYLIMLQKLPELRYVILFIEEVRRLKKSTKIQYRYLTLRQQNKVSEYHFGS